MHPQRIAVAIAAGFGLICSVTPWAHESSARQGYPGDVELLRWAALLCCAAILAGMVLVRRTAPLTPGGTGLCRFLGGLVGLVALLAILGPEPGTGSLHLLLVAAAAIALLPNIVSAGSLT